MVTIKNSKLNKNEEKQLKNDCLDIYESITGKRNILQYGENGEYDYEDADNFIYAFEELFNLEHNCDNADLENDIHELKARNNKINTTSAFRLCLKAYYDGGNWD